MELNSKVKQAKKVIKERFWLRQVVIAVSGMLVILVLLGIFLSVYTRHGQQYDMPRVVGLTLDEAKVKSYDLNLRFDVIDSIYVPQQPKGAILEQYPKAGSIIKKNRRVVVTVNSFEPKKVDVPYVAGLSLRSAKNRLVASGLEIGKISYVSDIATHNVLQQYFQGVAVSQGENIVAYMGSKIDLVVGLNDGESYPIVPALVGLSYRDARELLWERGYNISDVKATDDVDYTNMMDAIVVEQSLYPLAPAPHGEPIWVKISTDEKEIAKGKAIGKHRRESVESINEKLRLHRDTIEWIRRGRVVRHKNDKYIYEYTAMDTFAIHDRIMLLTQQLEEITGVQKRVE